MCIYESERSLSFLKECNIPIGKVIVNQIIPENTRCRFCSGKRRIQLERLGEIKSKFNSNKVMELKLFEEEVRGKESLERVARELYS